MQRWQGRHRAAILTMLKEQNVGRSLGRRRVGTTTKPKRLVKIPTKKNALSPLPLGRLQGWRR